MLGCDVEMKLRGKVPLRFFVLLLTSSSFLELFPRSIILGPFDKNAGEDVVEIPARSLVFLLAVSEDGKPFH